MFQYVASCFNTLLLVLKFYFCRTSAPQRLWSSSTHFFLTLIGWPMSTESTRWVSSADIFEPALCLGFWLSCCTHGSGCQCASWMETGIAQHYEMCYVGFQLCLWASVEQVFMQLRWCCRKVCFHLDCYWLSTDIAMEICSFQLTNMLQSPALVRTCSTGGNCGRLLHCLGWHHVSKPGCNWFQFCCWRRLPGPCRICKEGHGVCKSHFGDSKTGNKLYCCLIMALIHVSFKYLVGRWLVTDSKHLPEWDAALMHLPCTPNPDTRIRPCKFIANKLVVHTC